MIHGLLDTDQVWFVQNRDRSVMIRTASADEMNGEFMSLGPHDRSRRRIICWKVPQDVDRVFAAYRGKVLKIPFLQFSDEAVENSDEVLLPILNQIMRDAADEQGAQSRSKPLVIR